MPDTCVVALESIYRLPEGQGAAALLVHLGLLESEPSFLLPFLRLPEEEGVVGVQVFTFLHSGI